MLTVSSRRRLRRGLFCLTFTAAAVNAADYPPDSGWATFWGAFVDEVVGAPDAAALKSLGRFDAAGIVFDHPSVLRVSYDADDRQWRLWRGDFELEIHAGSYSEGHAAQLLRLMGGVLHSGDEAAVGPEPAPPLRLCGRDVVGQRLRLTFVGDRHEFLAYDLPLAGGESRLFLFDDILHDGQPSLTREATLRLLGETLRCIGD